MVYYYDEKTGQRLMEFEAYEFTVFRLGLHLLSTPVLYWRAKAWGASLAPDDYPDITVIRPGGALQPNVRVSETPQAPPGMTLRLLADQSTMDLSSHVRLPPAPDYKPWF